MVREGLPLTYSVAYAVFLFGRWDGEMKRLNDKVKIKYSPPKKNFNLIFKIY